MTVYLRRLLITLALICPTTTPAQEKALPPVGIQLDETVATQLYERVERINAEIQQLVGITSNANDWQADVEVLTRAVQLALEQQLFYQPKETQHAEQLLDEAERRLAAVKTGQRGLELLLPSQEPLNEPTPVVGGFVSRIDDSVQPFGLVIPKGFKLGDQSPHRMDVWLHGRGDNTVEVKFLKERMTKVGQYSPGDTFVLHPFGRHCNAYKFAGETDVYEAIAHVKTLIEVDSSRVAMRGFSMGGAGVWHLAVHDPGKWFAVNPGAGFVDTLVYQGWDQKPPYPLTDARKKLLNWYDVLPWVPNLKNTRLVAYSGEVDKQRAAAQRVEDEAKRLNVPITHIIGAGMGHKIDPPSAQKIDALLENIAIEITPPPRREIDFVTYTLRYPGVDWLQITGMQQHWTPSRVTASIDHAGIVIKTESVTSLKIDLGGSSSVWNRRRIPVEIDGDEVVALDRGDATGFQCELVRDRHWQLADLPKPGLHKRHGLQGPIDDAFCDRFIFVIPSRPAAHGAVQRWIDRELKYAPNRWRRLMRGDVRIVQDTMLTDQQIATCNLICFGDFLSNRFLTKIAGNLPFRWDRENIVVGETTYNANTHAAVFCYPNPANPNRYIVVNSGMTYRDFSNVSNSRQIAMLPDWAIVNVETKVDAIFPGEVVAEGFFDEQWQLPETATKEN